MSTKFTCPVCGAITEVLVECEVPEAWCHARHAKTKMTVEVVPATKPQKPRRRKAR